MEKKIIKKSSYFFLLPLLLLPLLPLIYKVGINLSSNAHNPHVAVLKYFIIPFFGFSLAGTLFFWIVHTDKKGPETLMMFIQKYDHRVMTVIFVLAIIYFSTLAALRYTSLHTTVLDMGGYDRKIWKISTAGGASFFHELNQAHFQPLLSIFALVYKVSSNPLIIQILQACFTISGVIPLYLLAKHTLKTSFAVYLIPLFFLFYPPVQFNSTLDFHPDHLYVFFSLWAFYFAERKKILLSIFLICIASLSKEPYLLGASFFGLYLCLAHKKFSFGLPLFFLALFFFISVISQVMPAANKSNELGAVSSQVFPFLDRSVNWSERIHLVLSSLMASKMKKLLFLHFLFSPFLFLPLLAWRRFIPALPFLAIPLLSTIPNHSAVDSQYTAGIIAPLFVSFLFVIKYLLEYYEKKYSTACLLMVGIIIIFFNIAHSPTPLSMSFWSPGWAQIWHRSNFYSGPHEKILKKAILIIPEDPFVKVMSQNNINHAKLAHRQTYSLFSGQWEKMDFILLDLKKDPMIEEKNDKKRFMKEFNKIQNNANYSVIFHEDGVFVFKKNND